ncbi:MAG: ribosomal RNA small subunit methyltransferase A [Candidatus Atribacteria bacterium]|nr:ribosomal RNA small subunit methyltransferase A [Candidatus Atribacteria bacterium]
MKSFYSITSLSLRKSIEYLKKYQIYPQKKYGQNFLIDKNIHIIMVNALNPNSDEAIFEIGTGLGGLTLSLVPMFRHVFSIERDIHFKPVLEDILSTYQNKVTILYQDILDFDWVGFLKQKKDEGFMIEKLVGNLPYSISFPLLKKIMEMHEYFKLAVVMVQKEVGERILAQPGDQDYGLISIVSKYYSFAEKIHLVRPDVFYPRPDVDSMIIRFKFSGKPNIRVEDEALFFDLVHAVFQHRRKNIWNTLKLFFGDKLNKNKLGKLLEEIGIPLNRRGENFSLEEFALLTREIKKNIH